MNKAKLTIGKARTLLAAKGITLEKPGPFDMNNMVATYYIIQDGVRKWVTSEDIKEMI